MADITEIKRELQKIAALTEEELLRYETLIEAAADSVIGEAPSHAALIAAARVNYQIALLQKSGDGVSSFKAGEVSISETNSSGIEAAKAFLTAVEAQYSNRAAKDGFAFRSVG